MDMKKVTIVLDLIIWSIPDISAYSFKKKSEYNIPSDFPPNDCVKSFGNNVAFAYILDHIVQQSFDKITCIKIYIICNIFKYFID